MEDIEHYDIPVYNFPYDVEEDDEETIQDNSELRVCFVTLDMPTEKLICGIRLFYLSLLLAPRKKLRLMVNLFALESTPGVLSKLITRSTLTLAA